jgi:uridine kinase
MHNQSTMNESLFPMSQRYVIAISGFVGSGKSTVSSALAKTLGDAPILMIDHYEHYVEWPQDMRQWVKDGADPSQIRVPKLKDDLLSLLNGQTITDPFDGTILKPSNYIILEEPSGRERQEIREYIDLVIFIDVPQDVCVIRMIERALNMELWKSRGTFESETSENHVQQLDAVALWTTQYQRARSMYMQVSQLVMAKADIIVNGMNPMDEITSDILRTIKEKQGVP